ncbi:MAG: NAD-dependent epimerase/dehydratase [Cyanobacteria bacterium RYN_339]|nr:NAD-dependent epimerase/dehydratase [Cyanobacteria bacterium RYN_339]
MLEKRIPRAQAPVLVTGGAGFIGSHVVDRLLADGERVVVIDDFNDFYDPRVKRANVEPHLQHPHYTLVEGDIRDADLVERVFLAHAPARVIHLAARAGVRPSLEEPLLYETTNVVATLILLEACRRHGVTKLVFGSSSSVYGVNAKVPFAEDDPIAQTISPYAATKAAGELHCHAYSHLYGLNIVCLRFFTVYGPRQRPDLAIHKFAKLITSGKPIPVFGDGGTERDYTFVDDIVAGILGALAYDKTRFEILNLGNSRTVSLAGLILALETALGKPAVIDRQPLQPGDVPRTFADTAKARRLLGYAPDTPIDVGLARFVAWFAPDAVRA